MRQLGKNILNRYRALLGQYCAANQFVELAKRVFVNEHGDLDNPEIFMQIASNYGLTLSGYNIQNVNKKVSLSYIVGIHLSFEVFLKEISDEMKVFGEYPVVSEKAQGESWLGFIDRTLLCDNKDTTIKGLIELCEYYRLVRNFAAHDVNARREVEIQYRRLANYQFAKEAKFARLSAPNTWSDIQFDDFVMFSRSSQLLACIVFKALKYNYEKVVGAIDPRVYHTFLGIPERLKAVLKAYILTNFRDDGTLEAKLDRIAELVMAR